MPWDIENVRSEFKLETILDVFNLMTLSKNFIEMDFIEEQRLPECLIAFFDLTLIYTMMYSHASKSFAFVDLFQHAKYLVTKVKENIALFRGKTDLLNRLLSNGMIKIFMGVVSEKISELKTNWKW